jgi:type II secretory pathway pseudopilin PulG
MPQRSSDSCHVAASRAFTLLELLVVMTVIIILVGLVMSGVSLISQSAATARTRGLVDRVAQAVLLYQSEDHRRRVPPAATDRALHYHVNGSAIAGVTYTLSLLVTQGFLVHGEDLEPDSGGASHVVDAWGQPLLYKPDEASDGIAHRPLDAVGLEVRVPTDVSDWNPRGTQPYPYIWSYGRPKAGHDLRGNAQHWIFRPEAP